MAKIYVDILLNGLTLSILDIKYLLLRVEESELVGNVKQTHWSNDLK